MHAGVASAGYLPGNEQPTLKFFAIMAVSYIAVSLLWVGLCAWQKSGTSSLHHVITVVVLLSTLETVSWSVASFVYDRELELKEQQNEIASLAYAACPQRPCPA